MVKAQNVDTELLADAMAKSGLRNSFFYEKLGISKQSFSNKCRGVTAFRKSEVFVMCSLLHLSDEEGMKIFFP